MAAEAFVPWSITLVLSPRAKVVKTSFATLQAPALVPLRTCISPLKNRRAGARRSCGQTGRRGGKGGGETPATPNTTRANTRRTTCLWMAKRAGSDKGTENLTAHVLDELHRAAAIHRESFGYALDYLHHGKLEFIMRYHGVCSSKRWRIHCHRHDRPNDRTYGAAHTGESPIPLHGSRAMTC